MNISHSPRHSRRLALGTALLVLAAAGCSATEPTLDERTDDLDAGFELYRTVDGTVHP